MKKVTALFLSAFSISAFSTELICAPDFEVFGLNADFGKSSLKVLQGKMEARMNSRQLVIPLSADSVAVTDDLNRQATWAKNSNCAYLLQTTLTRLGETVQVSTRLMDLNSSSYVSKKVYKANSPDDLHPIFAQVGNMLQDPKFAAVETIYDVSNADAKSLAKKKSSTYYSLSIGASYFEDFKELYGLGLGYFWDNKTFMGEAVYNLKFNSDANSVNEFGLRIYYPFSDRNNVFYIGGGVGFAITSRRYYEEYSYGGSYYEDSETYGDYGLLVECGAGYLVGRTSNFLFRIEANAGTLVHEGSIGGGLRLILGIGD